MLAVSVPAKNYNECDFGAVENHSRGKRVDVRRKFYFRAVATCDSRAESFYEKRI